MECPLSNMEWDTILTPCQVSAVRCIVQCLYIFWYMLQSTRLRLVTGQNPTILIDSPFNYLLDQTYCPFIYEVGDRKCLGPSFFFPLPPFYLVCPTSHLKCPATFEHGRTLSWHSKNLSRVLRLAKLAIRWSMCICLLKILC